MQEKKEKKILASFSTDEDPCMGLGHNISVTSVLGLLSCVMKRYGFGPLSLR